MAKKMSRDTKRPVLVVGTARSGLPYGWGIEDPIAQLEGSEKKAFLEEVDRAKNALGDISDRDSVALFSVAKRWMEEGRLEWFAHYIEYKISSIHGFKDIDDFMEALGPVIETVKPGILFLDSSRTRVFPRSFGHIIDEINIHLREHTECDYHYKKVTHPANNSLDGWGGWHETVPDNQYSVSRKEPYVIPEDFITDFAGKVPREDIICIFFNPARTGWNGKKRPFGENDWHDDEASYGHILNDALKHFGDKHIFERVVRKRVEMLRAQNWDSQLVRPSTGQKTDLGRWASATAMMRHFIGLKADPDMLEEDMLLFAGILDEYGIRPGQKVLDFGPGILPVAGLVLALYGCEVDVVDTEDAKLDLYFSTASNYITKNRNIGDDAKTVLSRLHKIPGDICDHLVDHKDTRYSLVVSMNTLDALIKRRMYDGAICLCRAIPERATLIIGTETDDNINNMRDFFEKTGFRMKESKAHFGGEMFRGYSNMIYGILLEEKQWRPSRARTKEELRFNNATEMIQYFIGESPNPGSHESDMLFAAELIDRYGIKPGDRVIDLGSETNPVAGFVLALYGCEVDVVQLGRSRTADYIDFIRLYSEGFAQNSVFAEEILSRIHPYRMNLGDFLAQTANRGYKLVISMDLLGSYIAEGSRLSDVAALADALQERAILLFGVSNRAQAAGVRAFFGRRGRTERSYRVIDGGTTFKGATNSVHALDLERKARKDPPRGSPASFIETLYKRFKGRPVSAGKIALELGLAFSTILNDAAGFKQAGLIEVRGRGDSAIIRSMVKDLSLEIVREIKDELTPLGFRARSKDVKRITESVLDRHSVKVAGKARLGDGTYRPMADIPIVRFQRRGHIQPGKDKLRDELEEKLGRHLKDLRET
ncbi:MAG: hypothetical protein JW800_07960, partial [Candidatus Omnitrophica bacterium]|nr:hypothetical protein [Candidatus Omnitrophota bacterium]